MTDQQKALRDAYITQLSEIRLRFQDLERDLKEITDNGVKSGVVTAEGFRDFSNFYNNLGILAKMADPTHKVAHFPDISTPEGLAMLIHEESDQVQEKVREMAKMTGVSLDTLAEKGLYTGFHLGDAADYMYDCFSHGVTE